MIQSFERRVKCPCCQWTNKVHVERIGEEQLRKWVQKYYSKQVDRDMYHHIQGIRLQNCARCSTYYYSDVPTREYAKQIYTDLIDPRVSFEKHVESSSHKKVKARTLLKKLIVLSGNARIHKLIDVGCGWGSFMAAAKTIGIEPLGVETADPKVGYLRGKGFNIVTSLVDIEESLYDIAILNQVLEHVSNPLEILRAIEKSLIADGVVYISVPRYDKSILKKKLLCEKGPLQPLEHLNMFSKRGILVMGESCGLELITKKNLVNMIVKAKLSGGLKTVLWLALKVIKPNGAYILIKKGN